MAGACGFCGIAAGEAPAWRVYEDATSLAFLDLRPRTEFHTLVIPRVHHTSLFDMPPDAVANLARSVKAVVDLFAERLGVTDVQVSNSSGAIAQQDVFHAHFHVVPRTEGDGQDSAWRTHPEWTARFDAMLERLGVRR